MILADTSVWVRHLGASDPAMAQLLADRQVVMHPFVIGEIALGSLRQREATFSDLEDLQLAPVAAPAEVRALIERQRIFARGIGYVDVHLVASCLLEGSLRLWTRDRRLHIAAAELGIAYWPEH